MFVQNYRKNNIRGFCFQYLDECEIVIKQNSSILELSAYIVKLKNKKIDN